MTRPRHPDGRFMSADEVACADVDRQEREWMRDDVVPRMNARMTFHEALIAAGGDVIAMPGSEPDPEHAAEIAAAYAKAGRKQPTLRCRGNA